MAKRHLDPDPKIQALKRHGTLNPHPEKVTDKLFLENAFFDPKDLLQVKYEMLRRVRIEGRVLTETSETFGCSRPSLYSAQAAFDKDGLGGLLPRRRGPRQGHKLTEAVMEFVEQTLAEDESRHARALVARLKERFGLIVHPRSIERALARREKNAAEPSEHAKGGHAKPRWRCSLRAAAQAGYGRLQSRRSGVSLRRWLGMGLVCPSRDGGVGRGLGKNRGRRQGGTAAAKRGRPDDRIRPRHGNHEPFGRDSGVSAAREEPGI